MSVRHFTEITNAFSSLSIGGCDMELDNENANKGEYTAFWDTAGFDSSKRGSREDVLVVLMVK